MAKKSSTLTLQADFYDALSDLETERGIKKEVFINTSKYKYYTQYYFNNDAIYCPAIAPSFVAVTTCLNCFDVTSPAANTPETFVS